MLSYAHKVNLLIKPLPAERIALGGLPEGGVGLSKAPEAASPNNTKQRLPPITRIAADNSGFVQFVKFVADSLMPPERQRLFVSHRQSYCTRVALLTLREEDCQGFLLLFNIFCAFALLGQQMCGLPKVETNLRDLYRPDAWQ